MRIAVMNRDPDAAARSLDDELDRGLGVEYRVGDEFRDDERNVLIGDANVPLLNDGDREPARVARGGRLGGQPDPGAP